MRTLAVMLLVWSSQPSYADEWVRVDRPAAPPGDTSSEVYVDRASVIRDGDRLEFDRVTVSLESKTYRPAMFDWRISFDCEWQTTRYVPQPSQTLLTHQRDSFNPDVTRIAEPLCMETEIAGEVLATKAAMLDDAARRFGFSDWAAASSFPPAPQFLRPAPPRPGQKPISDQDFAVAFPATGNRSVILLRDSLTRANGLVSGTSIWAVNAGVKPEPYEYQIAQYARRVFQADCSNGTIAIETAATTPTESMGDPVGHAPHASQAKARPGSASAALIAAACTDAPVQRLASAAEFFAYIDAPGEDPAFRARRTTRYGHDQVRWVQTPSLEDLAAALEQSGVKLTDLKWTSIWCAVTAAYKLVDCQTTTNSRFHEALDEAHLKFADRYIPAKETTDGKDIAGRTVEATIEWRADGARLKPITYKQSELTWERAPSEADFLRARILKSPAEVTFRCSVSTAYELSDCSAPSLTINGPRMSVTYHDLVMNGPEKTDERTQLAKGVRERVLPLLRTFKPSPSSKRGENTAGQYVTMTFAWK